MPRANHPAINHTHNTPARHQNPLRLTREEVRVLQYYRNLSDPDREAVRCLLHALQEPQPELTRRSACTRRRHRPKL